jgi:hypothetical protein
MGDSEQLANTNPPASTTDKSHHILDSYQHDVEKQPIHTIDSSNPAVDENSLKDPNIVDWESQDDPENPLNWPLSKKITAIGIVSLITLLSYVYLSKYIYLD